MAHIKPVNLPRMAEADLIHGLQYRSAHKIRVASPMSFGKLVRDARRVAAINGVAWGSKRLGGSTLQILSRMVKFPEGQMLAVDKNGVIVGAIHGIPGRISSLKDVPRKYSQVTGNMRGRRAKKGDNAIFCVSVTSDRNRNELVGVGASLVGYAALKSLALGYEHIFAYSAPREFSRAKKSDPSLTVRKHFESGKDHVLFKFHAVETVSKPKGVVVELFENARPGDAAAGGACALVEYRKQDIESWAVKNKDVLKPWFGQFGLSVSGGKLVKNP